MTYNDFISSIFISAAICRKHPTHELHSMIESVPLSETSCFQRASRTFACIASRSRPSRNRESLQVAQHIKLRERLATKCGCRSEVFDVLNRI